MGELTSKSFLNFLTSLLKSIGLLLLTFFLTPLLLSYIGAEDFGTFKVIMEVYGYLSLLEFGLYSSLIACLLPLIKKDDGEEINFLLRQGKNQYIKSALWTFGISLIILPFLPYLTSWGRKSPQDLYITFALVAATSVLIPFQPYKIFLEVSNQEHKVNVIIFFQNLSFILIGIFFAYFGWGLLSQGFAVLFSGCLGVLLIRYASKISLKGKFDKTKRFLPEMRKFQKSQVLNDLASKICLNCDQLIISIFLGPTMVTKVFLGQRVVMIMQGQLQSLGQSTYASLGTLYYSDIEIFKKRFMEVTKIISLVGVATLVPICILNQAFIALWVGDGYQVGGNALTYLAASNAFLFSLFSFWAFVFTALGKPSGITSMIWRQAVVNVIASIVATIYLGGIGPIAGTLISFIAVPLYYYPHLLKTHFGLSQVELMKTISVSALFGIAPLILYHYSPFKFNPTSWPTFFIIGILIFLTYSLFLVFALFNIEERLIFFNRLKVQCKKLLRK